MGRAISRQLPTLVEQGAAAAAPFLGVAMDLGLIRRQDPVQLARWMARITIATLLAPPDDDLQAELEAVLLPLLKV